MSGVYFHAEDGEAVLRGSERAYAGSVCSDLFVAALGLTGYVSEERVAQYLTIFPADHYLHGMTDKVHVRRSIVTALSVGREFFETALNTALVMGSDPVKLLARLHGQCELHAYVEGRDRAWLAALIEAGRTSKVLRADMGWEGVAALLRSSDSGTVVTSYSVCEQFPNRELAGNWYGDDDAWDALSDADKWRRALDGLYAMGDGRQMQPAGWGEFYFGDGTTAFDLLDDMRPTPEVPRG